MWQSRRDVLAGMILAGLAWTSLALTSGALAQSPAPQPLKPPPAAGQLKPGLDAVYFYEDFKHIENMPTSAAALAKGKRKQPVPNLDAGSGDGALWESGTTELYGVHFTGLIELAAGDYIFVANSNDGVRVTLDKTRIIDDPDIHGDRFSKPANVKITQAGWYPITVQYFQRRNTALLELHWQKPGGKQMEIVPPEAFAHQPATP